jgi:membrane associated rhomboid family serine protease
MPRNTSAQLGFPRFRGAVRNLIIFSTAVYLVLLLAAAFAPSHYVDTLSDWTMLNPKHIQQGWVWQFLTYGFIHGSPLGFLFAMLGIYFLGSAVEERIGSRRFYEMFLIALVGAGVLGFLFSLTKVIAQGPAWGSGPAANAILMVFFLLYRDAPIMLFPIPIPIPVKWIVIFSAAVQGAYLLLSHFALLFMVQLLGMGMGYVWYRAFARTSILGFFENQVSSSRNWYYRWKRERAKRKFQVYMRKHQHDPKQYFDEYGNFRPPDEKEKDKENGPGGWVN